MSLLIAGEWSESGEQADVRSPYSGDIVGSVTLARRDDIERALSAAVDGAREMARTPAWRRAELLERAAALIAADEAELAQTITSEQGKTTHEARAEASRIAGIFRLCAQEARNLWGDVLPMDATPEGEQRFGFTVREPCGVVVAISPFNYPAILVAHKIGPALAAGNAVILKPASTTPLTALFLVRRLVEAGLPPLALQCVVGSGGTIGEQLCSDRRVRKISFTGSRPVGERIASAAGLKRFTCELGSNTAVVVLEDADLALAASALGKSPFVNAGQNCVSPQRVIVSNTVLDQLLQLVVTNIDELRPGDPADPRTTVSPVIHLREAERVVGWIDDARGAGATVLRGGTHEGTVVEPSLILEPPAESPLWHDEVFGPAVSFRSVGDEHEALALVNESRYGLSFGVYTRDIDRALTFARGARTGIAHINSPAGTTWRADVMPWGGVGESGYGKEGPSYAVLEMTEEKVIVFHPKGSL